MSTLPHWWGGLHSIAFELGGSGLKCHREHGDSVNHLEFMTLRLLWWRPGIPSFWELGQAWNIHIVVPIILTNIHIHTGTSGLGADILVGCAEMIFDPGTCVFSQSDLSLGHTVSWQQWVHMNPSLETQIFGNPPCPDSKESVVIYRLKMFWLKMS